MGAIRSRLRRWHVWLGWVVGLPVLFWVVSGLVMIAKPIDEVRGEHLMEEMPAVRLTVPLIPPAIQGVPLAPTISGLAEPLQRGDELLRCACQVSSLEQRVTLAHQRVPLCRLLHRRRERHPNGRPRARR